MLLPDSLAEQIRCLHRRLYTKVCQNQAFFQLIVKIIIQLAEAGKHASQSRSHGIACFGQARLYLIKKTHIGSPYIIPQFPSTLPSDSDPDAEAY